MIDPALIPEGWGWALYHLDPSGPATVELYPNDADALEFSAESPLAAWAAVQAFLGVPIAAALFDVHGIPDQEGPPERDGGPHEGAAGSSKPGSSSSHPAPAAELDPFS